VKARPVLVASALAMLVAVGWRHAGLDPPSFWLDDQWAALVYRDFTWAEVFALRPPIPLGFILLQRPFAVSPWGLQGVPFLASLACIPVICWTVQRVTADTGAAIAVTLVAAGRSLLAIAAVHPKHYSSDVLVAAGIVALFVPILDTRLAPRRRRDLVAVGACAVALVFSFTSVFVAAPLAHVAAWRLRRLDFCLAVIAYDLLLGAAYFGFLAGSGSAAMTEYWAHAFVPLESAAGALGFLAAQLPIALGAALPSPWLALLALPGLAWLLRRPEWRGLAVACMGTLAALVMASALRVYPYAGGRTDLFLAPFVLLLLGCGLHALVSPISRAAVRSAILVVAGVAALVIGRGQVPYTPDTHAAELVRALDAQRKPGDAVLVYPHAAFALAYHGKWEYEPVPWPGYAHGFTVAFASPEVTLLPGIDGYAARPRLLDLALDAFLATAPDPVHYYATPLFNPSAHRYVLRRLSAAGYRISARQGTSVAELVRLERRANPGRS